MIVGLLNQELILLLDEVVDGIWWHWRHHHLIWNAHLWRPYWMRVKHVVLVVIVGVCRVEKTRENAVVHHGIRMECCSIHHHIHHHTVIRRRRCRCRWRRSSRWSDTARFTVCQCGHHVLLWFLLLLQSQFCDWHSSGWRRRVLIILSIGVLGLQRENLLTRWRHSSSRRRRRTSRRWNSRRTRRRESRWHVTKTIHIERFWSANRLIWLMVLMEMVHHGDEMDAKFEGNGDQITAIRMKTDLFSPYFDLLYVKVW